MSCGEDGMILCKQIPPYHLPGWFDVMPSAEKIYPVFSTHANSQPPPTPQFAAWEGPPYPETKEMERILQVNLITIPPLSLSEIQAELERLMKYVPIDVLTTRVEYVESLRWTGLPIYAHQSKFTSETIRVSLQMAYGVAKAMELQRKKCG